MKRNNPDQLSIFDVIFDHSKTPAEIPNHIPAPRPVEQSPPPDDDKRCPYPVPTVDDIIKLIDRSSYTVGKSKLISDVFACGALAISNLVDLTQYDEREEQYKQIINGYNPKERELIAEIFGKIFALLSSVTYDGGAFNDYLGELFMKCNQGNKGAGQFFTPFHISCFMAKAALMHVNIKEEPNEILAISDPCSGGGGMLMAALDVLKHDHHLNYTHHCFMEAGDIDIRCVHMTYLQLALAGVPAIVCHQNSLTNERWSVWKTPAFIFQYHRFYKYDINLSKEKMT